MSNEPAWLTRIDRLVGKANIQFNDLLRELRRALEHEHKLEEENKQLRALSGNAYLLEKDLSQDAKAVLQRMVLYDCEKTYRVQQILHDYLNQSAIQEKVDDIEDELRAFAHALHLGPDQAAIKAALAHEVSGAPPKPFVGKGRQKKS